MNFKYLIFLIFFYIESKNLTLKRLNQKLLACSLIKDENIKQKRTERIIKLISKKLQKKAKKKNKSTQKQSKKTEDDTYEILTTIGTIIAGFGKLIVNPTDAINLGTSLSAMIAGIINLAAKVTRTANLNENDIEAIICHFSNEQKNNLKILYSKIKPPSLDRLILLNQ